jgi:hypothetical protein
MEDAEALKAWFMQIAHKTAEAAKEGTFLGFGGSRVSTGETAGLNDLATALGTSAT